MGFNNPGRHFQPPPVYEAPLSYGVECDWGTISVTEEADLSLGLVPQPEITRSFETYGDRIRTPYKTPVEPAVHVLLADRAQIPGEQYGLGRLSSRTSLHPDSLHVVIGAGGLRDHIDLGIGMQLTADAERAGLDDPDELRFVDEDGRSIPAAEARREMVEGNMMNVIANTVSTNVTTGWEMWQRNQYNSTLLKRLRHVGYFTAGAALALEAIDIATGEPTIDHPGIMMIIGGVAAYLGLRDALRAASAREMAWRSTADRMGYHIGHSVFHTFYNPPEQPDGMPEAGA